MFLYDLGDAANHISLQAFRQLEHDSDRAAGVVAGSILEQRLKDYLISALPKSTITDTIVKERFHASAVFGAFSVKIDTAYMLGLITDQSHRDLSLIKDIRNRFAHFPEIDSFQKSEIKDRCKEMKSLESWMRDPTSDEIKWMKALKAGKEAQVAIRLPEAIVFKGASKKIKEPRYRYVQTALIFSFVFGMRARGHGPTAFEV